MDPIALIGGQYAGFLKDFTVISATDGNHGRALAAAARTFGCRCVIVLHANVSAEREDAIAAHGAEIVRIAGNYDASVAEAARLAEANGWKVVSDTSYAGYQDIPRDVMQGYGTMVREWLAQAGAQPDAPGPFTHVFLQGGVGGLAAGVISYLWECFGANRPTFIVVEPVQADCLCQSALQGRPARATGSVDSVMAGLACGETSPLAWRFLRDSVDVFMTIEDGDAVQAMRLLAAGGPRDQPIVAGESGAAGLAGLVALRGQDALCAAVGLDASARVLVINTEGRPRLQSMRGLSASHVRLCWRVGLRVVRADGHRSGKRPLQRRGVVRGTWSAAPASAAIPFQVSRGAPAELAAWFRSLRDIDTRHRCRPPARPDLTLPTTTPLPPRHRLQRPPRHLQKQALPGRDPLRVGTSAITGAGFSAQPGSRRTSVPADSSGAASHSERTITPSPSAAQSLITVPSFDDRAPDTLTLTTCLARPLSAVVSVKRQRVTSSSFSRRHRQGRWASSAGWVIGGSPARQAGLAHSTRSLGASGCPTHEESRASPIWMTMSAPDISASRLSDRCSMMASFGASRCRSRTIGAM